MSRIGQQGSSLLQADALEQRILHRLSQVLGTGRAIELLREIADELPLAVGLAAVGHGRLHQDVEQGAVELAQHRRGRRRHGRGGDVGTGRKDRAANDGYPKVAEAAVDVEVNARERLVGVASSQRSSVLSGVMANRPCTGAMVSSGLWS